MRAVFLIVLITLMVVVSAPAFAFWTKQAPAPEPSPSVEKPLEIAKPAVNFWGNHLRAEKVAQAKMVFANPTPAQMSTFDEPVPVMKVYKLQESCNPLPKYLGGSSGPSSPASVPEPGSIAVLGVGLVGLLVKRRR